MKSEVKENRVDFSLIRYSQCWEDTEVLLESLNIQENDICFGILSAGDNVFSMLAENPKKVVALDISFPQIALAKLKKEVFNSLSYEEMLEFMGVMKSDKRIEIYDRIKENLDKEVKEYWDFNKEAIQKGIIHAGKFEKFFKIFREKILPFVHSKKRIEKLLEKKSRQERIEYYDNHWNNFRWKLMFKLFFSKYIVGKLGRDKEFFRYAEKNISEEMKERSRYALCELNPYENPYINYILTGNYRKDCLPYFLRKENFDKIRRNLHKVEILQSSVEEYLDQIDFKINKFNLSDIFEYMSAENYSKLMEKIYDNAENNALLAYWNLIVERNSEKLDYKKTDSEIAVTGKEKNVNGKKYERMKELDRKLHEKDMTFFYTDFVVEKVIKNGNN
ncbi:MULTISPECIES: DUF3419 family protein [unclassified Leptotrichia]|uniref:DUF3419 family protein n=1 Tax=unclassified Leptotrichia TaxID=2633022 RepID=UPI0003ADAD3F|nr:MULTISPECIES: DUF3419 family protein [unclassified Leptotrichia]ERL26117.1 hypothetical protein HMPREF9108_01321 [Leptotrichia sp. oral taxon 225 str. F0581]WLD73415.1 DUF3419 family protein [Leptotrichia sp. HMT-225]